MKKFGHKIKIFYLNCVSRNSEQVLRLLRKSGYDFEVNLATSVKDFHTSVFEYNPEVIIADHGIDSSCLTETIELLKQSSLNIPVILVTDYESEEFAKILLKAGAHDYVFIEKPDRLPFAAASAADTYRSLQYYKGQMDQSQKEFSELVENLPLGFSLWSNDKQLVYFNQAMKDFSFEGEDGIFNQWRRINLDIYDQENNSVSLDKTVLTPCLREGRTVVQEDWYVLKQDGTKRYITVVANPSTSGPRSTAGITVLFFDATAQKVAQMKTRALNDLIQSKNNELSQFSYIISHNLRDPIAKILGLASICDTSTDDSRFIVKKITEEANKLDTVVKDLNVIVSVRNVEREKKESLIFDHEFSLVSQVLKREIQDSKAMIETDFNELNEIFTVKSYLHSVMYNLLSNSIKYRDLNKPLAIQMRTFKIGQYTCLSVRDNGLGIDLNKNREKVFGLYKRFHSENIPGKGVGLHFIKRYAEALGGKVEIESKLHEGTELKVYFLNNGNHGSE
jgi:signal transduction histidine kinase/CheY-like chemotaxis protein